MTAIVVRRIRLLTKSIQSNRYRFSGRARYPFRRNMASLWSANHGSDIINLGKGHPNPSLLPLESLKDAFIAASEGESAVVNMMQYGRMQGNMILCEQISQWVGKTSGREPPSPEQIMITTGSGPAMATVCQLFSKPGESIFIDSPAYFLSFFTFKDCGLHVVEIPTNSHGLNVDLVEKRLREGERPSLVYTVPFGNNPTGASMTNDKKRRLVELSRQYGFKIVSDEVYQFLSFTESLPTSLFEYDDPNSPSVIAVNSFSKLLGPGLRIGWLTAHQPIMERILRCGSLQSGGGFNPMTSAVLCEMMSSGAVEKQVEATRNHYKRTCDTLSAEVKRQLQPALHEGETVSFEAPTGGFFMFITLPERFDGEKLLDLAKKHGVSFFAGCHSSADGSNFKNCIRLCFAFLDEDSIRKGVRRLADAIRAYE